MKESKGIPRRIDASQVRRITTTPKAHRKERADTALVCGESQGREDFCITSSPGDEKMTGLCSVPGGFLTRLREGDIVKVDPDGRISLVWDTGSRQNPLYLTDYCNSRCIMCPQTPEAHPCHHDETAKRMLRLLAVPEPPSFGITGGEPTLVLDGLVEVLDLLRERFPSSPVQLLTNGRRLADFQVATRVAESAPRGLVFCIPVFADNDVEHDAITGAKGSFRETVAGIHNLVRYGRPIEIRVVIVRQNAERLADLAHFIFWNFPFAVHIAFMAMETSGVACANLDEVWVEPSDYRGALEKAVVFLNQRMMRVSLYNLPLCLISEKVRPFARDSISDWKKMFLPECGECSQKASCGGFFGTSVRKPSQIKPFKGGDTIPEKQKKEGGTSIFL
ncbi:MAG: His-Xaa-Ser system radical SAM maturase HxsC [Candidatus Eremiobacteraeota bacterium]|nr:His-Xaa-Ser system radical SAM maturase HxsC [Candidatus Eremiobacteraeota bacterium]